MGRRGSALWVLGLEPAQVGSESHSCWAASLKGADVVRLGPVPHSENKKHRHSNGACRRWEFGKTVCLWLFVSIQIDLSLE